MILDRRRIGEEVLISTRSGQEIRTITSTILNAEGKPVVVWSSNREEGGCVPSLWDAWAKGKSR